MTGAGALWADQLAGIPEGLVIEALHHFAGRVDWPPSLAEIRKRALGVASLEEVRADLGPRLQGFTRMVWGYLDHYLFTRSDTRDAERMLRAAYDFATERRLCGEPFPPELVAITQQERRYTRHSPEHRARVIAAAQAAVSSTQGDSP